MRFLFAPWLERADYQQEAAIARWQGVNVEQRLIDVTRAATRQKHRVLSEAIELHPDTAAHDSTIAAVLEREEIAETVRMVRQLAPRQRRCLVRSVSGDTLDEIAAAEGLTWKQAENAVSWARKTLRERTAA